MRTRHTGFGSTKPYPPSPSRCVCGRRRPSTIDPTPYTNGTPSLEPPVVLTPASPLPRLSFSRDEIEPHRGLTKLKLSTGEPFSVENEAPRSERRGFQTLVRLFLPRLFDSCRFHEMVTSTRETIIDQAARFSEVALGTVYSRRSGT